MSDTTLTMEQDLLLFDMLGKAVERATGVLQIPGHRTHKQGVRQKKEIEELRDGITETFVKKLPQLIAKFGAEPTKAAVLVKLPLSFNLEGCAVLPGAIFESLCLTLFLFRIPVYGTSQSMAQFNATLKHVVGIFSKSSDSDLLGSCAAVLQYFCENELPIHQKAETSVDALISASIESVESSVSEGALNCSCGLSLVGLDWF